MQVKELKYHNFECFLKHILFPGEFEYEFSNAGSDWWIYRGESSGKYKLVPSALREGSEKILRAEWGGREFRSVGELIRCEHFKLWQFFRIANENGLKITSSDDMKKEYLSSMVSNFNFQKTNYKKRNYPL